LKRQQRFERFNRPIPARDLGVGRFTRLQAEMIKKEKTPKGKKKKVGKKNPKLQKAALPVETTLKTDSVEPEIKPENPTEKSKVRKLRPVPSPVPPTKPQTGLSQRPRRSVGNYCAITHKDEVEQNVAETDSNKIDVSEPEIKTEENNEAEKIDSVDPNLDKADLELKVSDKADSEKTVSDKTDFDKARDLATVKELMSEMLDRVEKAVVVISKAEELNLSVDDAKNKLTHSSVACSRKRKRKSDAPTRYFETKCYKFIFLWVCHNNFPFDL
jgi:hypothetical protein